MPNEAQRPIQEEDLVAYLDGELETQQAAAIETRLAADARLQQQLQGLSRAWDLLDELPRAPSDRDLTAATIAMAAEAATLELAQQGRWWQGTQRWLWTIGAPLAVLLVACAATYLVLPDRNRQLLEDLPVLEHLDDYRQAESVEFLRQLAAGGMFPAEGEAAASAPGEMP
jgi:anti-sigma factor RsiW